MHGPIAPAVIHERVPDEHAPDLNLETLNFSRQGDQRIYDRVTAAKVGATVMLAAGDFQPLLEALAGRGYQLVGPTLRDGQLIYGDLPGWPTCPWAGPRSGGGGAFRLKTRDDQALFGYGVGQQSWKQFLFPPRQTAVAGPTGGRRFPDHPPGRGSPPVRLHRGPRPATSTPWRSRTGSSSRARTWTRSIRPAGSRPSSWRSTAAARAAAPVSASPWAPAPGPPSASTWP